MPVIEQKANSIDDYALTRKKGGGTGGGSFRAQVVRAADDIAKNLPVSPATVQITEIADLVIQQDDNVYCTLINNNVNLRFGSSAASSIALSNKPSITADPANPALIPFNTKYFSGGGMEQMKDTYYFTSNKCGVYRVSFGLNFRGAVGITLNDAAVFLICKNMSQDSPKYGGAGTNKFWRTFGNLNKFWANGSDLIELDCGESIALGIRSEAFGGGISTGQFDYDAWIAINYTGNQH